ALLADRDPFALEVGERLYRALRQDDEVGGFGKEAGDRPQLAQRALGEQLHAGISPAGEIGLSKAGFEWPAVDLAEVLDRAGRRLGDRDEAAHPATPAATAGRAIGRARDCAGHQAADLEKATPGRRRADAEKPRLLGQRHRAKRCRKKQTGADEAAPEMPHNPRLT